MTRRAVLTFGLVLALLALAVLVPPRWPTGSPSAVVPACAARPEADCLLDIGTAILLAERESSPGSSWFGPLVAAGRLDEAEAILALHREREGASPEEARASARDGLSVIRFTHEIQAGVTLEEALASLPEANGSHLYTAGIGLLNGTFHVIPGLTPNHTPSPSDQVIVAALASRILLWASTDPERVPAWQLTRAAELFALLGDRARVLETLQLMKEHGADPVGLHEPVYEVVGSKAVLDLADLTDPSSAILLERAAMVERDDVRAAEHLQRAFDFEEIQEVWPDFSGMLRVVERAADRDLPSTTRTLADQMVQLAETESENPFRVFDHIKAAKALLRAGADRQEITEQLDRARALFPSRLQDVVAFGLISGPMQWEGSGLADEAKRGIAAVLVSLGDVERGVELLHAMTYPEQGWLDLTELDLPVPVLDALLGAARRQLPSESAAYVAGQFARKIISSERTPQQDAWALKVARELARVPQPWRFTRVRQPRRWPSWRSIRATRRLGSARWKLWHARP